MDKCNTCYKWSKDGCYDKTRSCQYVEKKPVIKGRWKKISPAGIYQCSVCNGYIMPAEIDVYKFCNQCGASMEVDE
jgi:hypothetical protein